MNQIADGEIPPYSPLCKRGVRGGFLSNKPPEGLKKDIIAYAYSLGFSHAGVTSAEPLEQAESFLENWINEGRAGEMAYLEKDPKRRTRPSALLPGAKSVIALAVSYFNPISPSPLAGEGGDGGVYAGRHLPPPVSSPARGEEKRTEAKVARYAWGKDYHKVIDKRLKALVRYMESLAPDVQCKTFVDTGPLLERPLAQRGGIGFIGKNTMLITRGWGSWVFLANVITTIELPTDQPDIRSCGSCRLCIDACPTQAITAPYELDARRCIAYLTIESDKETPVDLRHQTGEWLFGCDICQEACPHNTRVPQTPVPEFQSRKPEIDLHEILAIKTEEQFRTRFGGTPLARAERHGLLRNACLVAVHTQRKDLLPRLEELAHDDPHPAVREHAAWALSELVKEG